MLNGPRLAVSWLTVLPVRGPGTVDRADATRAIALAPLVGGLLGAVAAGLLWVLDQAGASAPLAGLLVVAVLALITRGMHLDGLADTMDGLGSYGPPDRAPPRTSVRCGEVCDACDISARYQHAVALRSSSASKILGVQVANSVTPSSPHLLEMRRKPLMIVSRARGTGQQPGGRRKKW